MKRMLSFCELHDLSLMETKMVTWALKGSKFMSNIWNMVDASWRKVVKSHVYGKKNIVIALFVCAIRAVKA